MSLWKLAPTPLLPSQPALSSHCTPAPKLIICSNHQKNRSYRNLSTRTRLLFGLGLMGYAAFGLWAEPRVERTLGMVPTEEEKEDLEKKISVRIRSVEK